MSERNSSFELLRILSMLLIVAHHYVIHADFDYNNMLLFNKIYLRFLLSSGQIGVNCFVLISAFFLSQTTINATKIIRLEIQVLFYSILIGFAFFLFFDISVKDLIKSFCPVIFQEYWFYKVYIMLYILTPFLNLFIKQLDKNQFRKLLIVLFCIFSFLPSVYSYWENNVFSMFEWFIFVYFCAAYIRIYREDFFKKRRAYLGFACLIYILFFMIFIIFNMKIHFIAANNIFVFLISVFIFLCFLNINIGCIKFINMIASATFGVYLLHDNPHLRSLLWNVILRNSSYQNRYILVIHSIISICSVYVVFTLIDLLRNFLFNRIFKIWEKRK